jgi:hypothetical protein
LAASTAGCAIVPVSVRDQHSGKLLNESDGSPIGGAKLTVRSWSISMPGAMRHGLETEMSTVTDNEGRWMVRSRFDLKLAIFLPEGGPNFGDELIFEVPDGRRLVIPDAWRRRPSVADGGLLIVADAIESRRPRAVTTAGVTFGGAEAAAAYYGGLLFLVDEPIRLAVRADVRPGVRAGSAGLGLGLLPSTGEGVVPFPGAVLGYRYVRRWSKSGDSPWLLGPEVSISFLGLRCSLMAEAPTFFASMLERHYSVAVGFGYL